MRTADISDNCVESRTAQLVQLVDMLYETSSILKIYTWHRVIVMANESFISFSGNFPDISSEVIY